VTFADAYAGHVKAFCTSDGAFSSAKRCTTDYLLVFAPCIGGPAVFLRRND